MHHCTSGVTECGSLLARVDSRTQEKTLRCILVQAIGALRPAVVVLCIREHPNRGLQRKRKRFDTGWLVALLRLIGGEVSSPAMKKNSPLSYIPTKVGYKAVWGFSLIVYVRRSLGGRCCGMEHLGVVVEPGEPWAPPALLALTL